MDLIIWGENPWGREIPVHIAWYLIWVSLFAGFAFLVVHAIRVRFRPTHLSSDTEATSEEMVSRIPENVPRHSLAARLFHWLMAASMLTLLFSAFLPKAGLLFSWVTIHWSAGLILTLFILFHICHAILGMEFGSIWPDRADIRNAWRGMRPLSRTIGQTPGKSGKYPLANKLYHLAVMVCGIFMAATGILMLWRVPTPFLVRNPYLLDDTTWGMVYLLHGFAGVALIALVMIHVYFALRPEKLPITKAMVSGFMDREFYLKHHDPERWGRDRQTTGRI